MKRFYTLVSIAETKTGYEVLLDGKPVKTPLKRALLAPNETIAMAIQKEWAEQEEEINPAAMPITQILSTQIDRIADERSTIAATLLKYLDTDLVCYRADHPPELQAAQEKAWDPYLTWFEEYCGEGLKITTGLSALSQDPKATHAVKTYIETLDDARFMVLQLIASLSGSLVLAMAALEVQKIADDLFAAMRVEENFKAEIYNEDFYGPDPAQDEKDKAIKAELEAALEYLRML